MQTRAHCSFTRTCVAPHMHVLTTRRSVRTCTATDTSMCSSVRCWLDGAIPGPRGGSTHFNFFLVEEEKKDPHSHVWCENTRVASLHPDLRPTSTSSTLLLAVGSLLLHAVTRASVTPGGRGGRANARHVGQRGKCVCERLAVVCVDRAGQSRCRSTTQWWSTSVWGRGGEVGGLPLSCAGLAGGARTGRPAAACSGSLLELALVDSSRMEGQKGCGAVALHATLYVGE